MHACILPSATHSRESLYHVHGLKLYFYFHNVIGSRGIGGMEQDSRGFTPSCCSLHYLLRRGLRCPGSSAISRAMNSCLLLECTATLTCVKLGTVRLETAKLAVRSGTTRETCLLGAGARLRFHSRFQNDPWWDRDSLRWIYECMSSLVYRAILSLQVPLR